MIVGVLLKEVVVGWATCSYRLIVMCRRGRRNWERCLFSMLMVNVEWHSRERTTSKNQMAAGMFSFSVHLWFHLLPDSPIQPEIWPPPLPGLPLQPESPPQPPPAAAAGFAGMPQFQLLTGAPAPPRFCPWWPPWWLPWWWEWWCCWWWDWLLPCRGLWLPPRPPLKTEAPWKCKQIISWLWAPLPVTGINAATHARGELRVGCRERRELRHHHAHAGGQVGHLERHATEKGKQTADNVNKQTADNVNKDLRGLKGPHHSGLALSEHLLLLFLVRWRFGEADFQVGAHQVGFVHGFHSFDGLVSVLKMDESVILQCNKI